MADAATWGTGRRKESVARVRLIKGTGAIQCNGRPLDKYFKTESDRIHAVTPLLVTKTQAKYDVHATLSGGGMSGQSGAFRLGVSRCLKTLEPALEAKLKEEGLLTRDPRMKERKKYGRRGARRGCQFSKR